MRNTFEKTTRMPVSAKVIYDWHMSDGAFERLVPPFEAVRLKSKDMDMVDGSRALLGIQAGPIELEWLAEHDEFVEGEKFVDVQLKGPFAYWKHSHEFINDGEGGLLKDKIEYELPLSTQNIEALDCVVRKKLERVFSYRHNVTKNDLSLLAKMEEKKSMKVLVTGASGLIGSTLVPFLKTQGHQVVKMVRSGDVDNLTWDPENGNLSKEDLEGYDAIISLSGENIASGRWTDEKKRRLRDSRIKTTKLLADTISTLDNPPAVFVCASAIGFYGDSGDSEVSESSEKGTGFLAELCEEWESIAQGAGSDKTRVVNLRFGVVLSPSGGMLQKLMPPFMMGAGGRIGSGKQYMSWISVDDAVGVIGHSLSNENLNGPVNVVSPNPCTNQEFTKVLGRVISRPTIFPVPSFAANIAFGEMAEETMLASCKVMPEKLSSSNYQFRQPDLESALRHLLGKPQRKSA